MTRSVINYLLVFSIWLILPRMAVSETFIVNTGADTHDINPGDSLAADNSDPLLSRISLRAAIEEANALPGPDTVILNDVTLIVQISLGPILISDDSTVVKGNEGFPVIDGYKAPYGNSLIEIHSDYNIIEGLTFKRSRNHGLVITGANNQIGGSTTIQRNQFLGCGLDYSDASALVIKGGSAVENIIKANWLGLYGNGTECYGNTNGILFTDSANHNTISANIITSPCFISASEGWGLRINKGAHNNRIEGCVVGLDLIWSKSEGNKLGGVLIDRSGNNRIGGTEYETINIISGNYGPGLALQGETCRDNIIAGNFVGVDTSGLVSIANHDGGLLISQGACYNTIGDELDLPANIFSGNFGDGIRITGLGTDNNLIVGNYVGPSYNGGALYAGDTYSLNGIVITDGARYNTIGSSSPEGYNVISLNEAAGLLLHSAGTSYNTIIGNYIGIAAWGFSSAPNGTGVVIRAGASQNQIGGSMTGERNIISGNRAEVYPWGAGVVIYDAGTKYNSVIGNYIGTDVGGTRALRNGSSGVIIGNGAQYNSIGGISSGMGNVISGNGAGLDVFSIARGITITDFGTTNNTIQGNLIGPRPDLSNYLNNWGHGIGIFGGASNNLIGGDTPTAGNIIAGNNAFGILVDGYLTDNNLIRNNIIGKNDSLDIGLRNNANQQLTPPTILLTTVETTTGFASNAGISIDLYRYYEDPLTGDLEQNLIGSGETYSDSTFSISTQLLSPGDSIRAIATTTTGASSQFSQLVVVEQPTDMNDQDAPLPYRFVLRQNYPNPFNPSTNISFTIPRRMKVSLTIYNITGQQIAQPVNEILGAGDHMTSWDGLSTDKHIMASGVYLYRLQAGQWTQAHKAILLR